MSKIAVISVAHIHSKEFCKQLCELTPEKRPYVIWDENPERGAAYAETYGSRFEPDLGNVLADDAIEGFVICAENTRHLPLLEKVMPLGKPVMCEKPLATSAVDAARILELAREFKTPLISGYFYPFFAEHRAAATLAADGTLGKVTHLNFRNAHNAAYGHWFDNPELAWFTDPELSGGGALLDMGTHAVHLLCHLGGKVEAVWATCANLSGVYPKVDDYGLIVMRFANGIIGRVEAGWVFTGGLGGLEAIGSEKSIWNNGEKLVFGVRGKAEDLPPAEARPDRIPRLLALVNGELSAEELEADLTASIGAVCVMDAAYASAQSGQWVTLD